MNILILILAISIPLIILSWTLPEKWQLTPVGIATVGVLTYLSPVSLIILATSALSSYFLLKYYQSLLAATIITVIQISAIFLFFKLRFGEAFHLTNDLILPLGLSYYSFRIIHYTIEAYKQSLPRHSLLDYLNYLFFLPTFLVGPINRFSPFIKDFKKRRWNNQYAAEGLERILYGLSKIVVIGNYLLSHKITNYNIDHFEQATWLFAYIKMFTFTANAYFQFAGYSDVAIGLSLLFGFRVTENFNFPFMAQNIADFWKRWHISLSEWCRDYVFYPFLSITRNPRFSIIMSMVILGIWHEISLRYLLWGASHAIAINIWHHYEKTKLNQFLMKFPKLKGAIGILVTLHFVMLSFVLISETDLQASLIQLKILFGLTL